MTNNKFTGTTIAEGKSYLRANFHDGCVCPACGQTTRAYRRPITSAMCVVLFLMYRQFRNEESSTLSEYIHVENLLKEAHCSASSRGDFPKLKHWGLIDAKSYNREDGSSRNGYYRITEKGEQFLKGEIKIASHVIIFNNKVLGFSSDTIDIHKALKNKFSYEELMGGVSV